MFLEQKPLYLTPSAEGRYREMSSFILVTGSQLQDGQWIRREQGLEQGDLRGGHCSHPGMTGRQRDEDGGD